MFTESLEVGITCILIFQGFVREIARITIDNAPIICIICLIVNRLEVECYTTRTLIIFQEIIGSGIFEQLS